MEAGTTINERDSNSPKHALFAFLQAVKHQERNIMRAVERLLTLQFAWKSWNSEIHSKSAPPSTSRTSLPRSSQLRFFMKSEDVPVFELHKVTTGDLIFFFLLFTITSYSHEAHSSSQRYIALPLSHLWYKKASVARTHRSYAFREFKRAAHAREL